MSVSAYAALRSDRPALAVRVQCSLERIGVSRARLNDGRGVRQGFISPIMSTTRGNPVHGSGTRGVGGPKAREPREIARGADTRIFAGAGPILSELRSYSLQKGSVQELLERSGRAGASGGGLDGSLRQSKIFRAASGAMITVRIRIDPPQRSH